MRRNNWLERGYRGIGLSLAMVLFGMQLGLAQVVINLHPPGFQSSEANAIQNGVAAGGGILADGTQSALLWTSLNANVVTVLNQGTTGSWGWAMSNGVVVGPSWTATVHASAWDSNGTFIDLNPPFTAWSNAFSVSHPSQASLFVTVGIALYTNVYHAVAWAEPNANNLIDLHPTGAGQSFAFGINDAGQVCGAVDNQAAFWNDYQDPASYQNIHPAGASASFALAVAANGQVGGFAVFDGTEHAYLWDPATGNAIDLHPPTATGDSEVLGIFSPPGGGGVIPVGFAYFNGEQHAMLWFCAGGGLDLHPALPAGYTLSWARGVWMDSDGTIYVSGAAGDASHSEAIVWVIAPDTNGDGCMDDADLLAILLNFGLVGCSPYDLNGDGAVDDGDLLIALFNFGNGC